MARPGRLHLVPHVNAPVADFPVRKIIGAHHFVADLTLPYGRVLYDYNKELASFGFGFSEATHRAHLKFHRRYSAVSSLSDLIGGANAVTRM